MTVGASVQVGKYYMHERAFDGFVEVLSETDTSVRVQWFALGFEGKPWACWSPGSGFCFSTIPKSALDMSKWREIDPFTERVL